MTKISILISAYNEEATIIPLLKSFWKEISKIKKVAFEVIDDCSQDQTNQRLRDNETLYHHLISLEKNQGKGGAVLRDWRRRRRLYFIPGCQFGIQPRRL